MKACPDCGQILELDRFGVNRRQNDGLSRICRACISMKNRKYYLAHREDRVLKQSAYYQRTKDARPRTDDPELIERKRTRERKYYHAKYRERKREQNQRWRTQNPEIVRARMQRYRANRSENGSVPFSLDQWQAKVSYWGWKCWICRRPLDKYHQDHVKPISKGGMHCLANLRPACASCNTSKGNTWPYSPKETTEYATTSL